MLNYRQCGLLLAVMLSEMAGSRTVDVDIAPNPISRQQAPIALLVDLSSGQTLFAREADARFLPASMTKAMTALVAFDLIKAGHLREDTFVTVRPETSRRWAGKGTTLNLRPNEQVRIGDLLMGVTAVSANDAAVALAEAGLGSLEGWVGAMNARARVLGLTGSHFGTPNGFPDRGATYVTARDMVKLASALIIEHPELYRRYIGKQAMEWRGQRLISHDPFAGVVPGADGIKTGHTFEAGFNFLGTVERGGRRVVVVVGRSPNESARAAASKGLVEWSYAELDSRPFLQPDWIVGAIKVQDGDARQVNVAVPRAYSIAVRRDIQPHITARIVYNGPVRAPIARGAPVATLEIHGTGLPAHSIPLVAMHAIGKAGPIDRIVGGLLGLFS